MFLLCLVWLCGGWLVGMHHTPLPLAAAFSPPFSSKKISMDQPETTVSPQMQPKRHYQQLKLLPNGMHTPPRSFTNYQSRFDLEEEEWRMRNSGLYYPPNDYDRLRNAPPPPPIARKTKISYTDAGTLCITLEPAGLGTSALFGGAFSLAWFSAIVPATFTSAGTALFLLPFWAAGGMVAKTSVIDPLVGTSLTIGEYAWSVQATLGGKRLIKENSGATTEITGAGVEVGLVQDGTPAQYYLQLYGTDCQLGMGMAKEELERLAKKINAHLAQFPSTLEE